VTRARQRLGRLAEDLALGHLEAAGLTLVARNWSAPPRPGFGGHGGELDLVMRDGATLVIVEVRSGTPRATRSAPAALPSETPSARPESFAGGAAYTVGPAKQRRLAVLTQLFAARLTPRPSAYRFDVVTVTSRGSELELRWYKNAFQVG